MHPSQQSPSAMPAARPADNSARSKGIQRATLVAIVTNSLLAAGQVVIGVFANAFSLVADATHTLSDLITDMMVPVDIQEA